MAEINEDQINRRLEAISEFKVNPEITARDIERVRETLTEQSKQETGRQSIWRIVLGNRMMKLAAAAVMIAAVLVGLYYSGYPLAITSPAFGEVIDNVLSQKWIYMFEEDRKDGQITMEYWYNPAGRKLYAKSHREEGVIFLDVNNGETHQYRNETITISKPDNLGNVTGWLDKRLPMLGGLLNRFEREGADIVQKDAVYNSELALLYEIEITLPDRNSLRTDKYTWLVNKQTHLPIICEYTHLYGHKHNGKFNQSVMRSHRYAFDYSDSGPADIYVLGVPEDSVVVDERPSPEIQALIDNIELVKTTKYNSFAAVKIEGDMPRKRIIRNGGKFREEHLELKINYSDWEPRKVEYLEAMGESFESINQWLNETQIMRRRISISDENLTYETSDWDIEGNEPIEIKRRWGYYDYFILHLWRSMPSGQIVSTEYSKQYNLICTLSNDDYNYYDPSKNYLWVRHEKKNGQLVYEVEEFGRTVSGTWYPHKIRDTYYGRDAESNELIPHSQVIMIYAADLDTELAREVDPQVLPNYVDHRELTRQTKMDMQQEQEQDIVEYTGFTPLHIAIYRQDINKVRKYLQEGAEVEPEYDSGATPMELAVSSGNLEIVRLLFEHGADFISNDSEQRSALGLATSLGHERIVEFILANGPNVNEVYKGGATALHYAAEKGDVEEVRRLLAHGADFNIRDNQGRTCLYKAIDSLAGEVFHLKSTKSETIESLKKVITVLVENGADINALDRENDSAFTRSVRILADDSRNTEQQIEFIRFVLASGADPVLDARDRHRSVLSWAVEHGRYDMVKAMLEGGADPWLVSSRDYWPIRYNMLHWARLRRDDRLYELLYPYMKERYEQTNEELLELASQVVRASLASDMTTINSICVDHPHDLKGWTAASEKIRQLYEGHESLLDEMFPGWFTLDGFGEVYIPLQEEMEDEGILLGFVRYPDGQWKCMKYYKVKDMPEYGTAYHGDFVQDSQWLDDFKDYMHDQAGMKERVSTQDKGGSTLHGKFKGTLVLTVEDGILRVDFDEEYWRKGYVLLTGDRVKVYTGTELRVYLKERIYRQKEYPQTISFRPYAMIVENGDSTHTFTLSDGQILMRRGEHTTKADKFVFDLDAYEVISSK